MPCRRTRSLTAVRHPRWLDEIESCELRYGDEAPGLTLRPRPQHDLGGGTDDCYTVKKNLKKRLQSGCALYYFYASDEALVHAAAQKALKYLNRDDPETTVLDGPTPRWRRSCWQRVRSPFGGKRLVLMPLIRPSTYSDKDLQELCDTLADTEKCDLRHDGGRGGGVRQAAPRQAGAEAHRLLRKSWGTACRSTAPQGQRCRLWPAIGQKQAGAAFAPGAEAALLVRCGEDQFLLKNEIEKLAALSGYGTITQQMVGQLGTVTLDADTFDMVKLLTGGQTDKAQQKLKTLLALQNDPIMITGALDQQLSGSVPRAAGPPQPPQSGGCSQGFRL